MGVLQIDMRSERLRNLGGVSGVRYETGKDRGAHIVGQAKDRLLESNKRLGGSVADLGKALCNVAVSMTEFDRKIRLDDFSMKYQSEMNAFMLGDGEKNTGAINEDFTDGRAWMDKIERKRQEVEARLRSECKITDWEWKRDGERITHGFDEQWRARMATHAFQVNEKRSMVAATGRRDAIEQTLALGDGTTEMYGDWYSARTNEAIAHHAGIRKNPETDEVEIYDPDIFRRFMRDGALKLVGRQWENKVKLVSAACADMEDRKDVEAAFAEAAKGWKREDGTYNFAEFVKDKKVLAALGDEGLAGYDKSFESDWNTARRSAVRRAESNQRIRRADDARAADEAQISILNSVPRPDTDDHRELAAYHAKRSAAYTSFLSSPEGLRLKDTFPARYKAMSIMAQDERVDAGVETRKGNGERFLSMLADGFVGQHEITPAEIQATADDLLVSEQISRDDYDKAIRFKKKALTPKAKALHDMIFADKEVKFPEMCRWQESFGQFEIPNTKAGAKAASAKMELTSRKNPWYMFDDTETRLYSEIVKGANYAMEYMEAKNCTVEQAYAEFESVTRGTTEDLAKLAYEERLERRKDMLDEFKAAGPNRKASFAGKVLEQ